MSIQIFFGPYEAHGIISHKTQKLHGMLNALGYEVELIPTNWLNILTVNMKNKQIYRCDIRNLMFNVDYEDDIVAQKVVACIEEAKERFYSEQNVPSFSLKEKIATGNTQDLFSDDVALIYEIPRSWERMKNKKRNS